MRLPDPFTPNLKVDLLPEIAQSPRVLTDYMAALTERGQSINTPFRIYQHPKRTISTHLLISY